MNKSKYYEDLNVEQTFTFDDVKKICKLGFTFPEELGDSRNLLEDKTSKFDVNFCDL